MYLTILLVYWYKWVDELPDYLVDGNGSSQSLRREGHHVLIHHVKLSFVIYTETTACARSLSVGCSQKKRRRKEYLLFFSFWIQGQGSGPNSNLLKNFYYFYCSCR